MQNASHWLGSGVAESLWPDATPAVSGVEHGMMKNHAIMLVCPPAGPQVDVGLPSVPFCLMGAVWSVPHRILRPPQPHRTGRAGRGARRTARRGESQACDGRSSLRADEDRSRRRAPDPEGAPRRWQERQPRLPEEPGHELARRARVTPQFGVARAPRGPRRALGPRQRQALAMEPHRGLRHIQDGSQRVMGGLRPERTRHVR